MAILKRRINKFLAESNQFAQEGSNRSLREAEYDASKHESRLKQAIQDDLSEMFKAKTEMTERGDKTTLYPSGVTAVRISLHNWEGSDPDIIDYRGKLSLSVQNENGVTMEKVKNPTLQDWDRLTEKLQKVADAYRQARERGENFGDAINDAFRQVF